MDRTDLFVTWMARRVLVQMDTLGHVELGLACARRVTAAMTHGHA